MAHKTQGVCNLVELALRNIQPPYSSDVIYQVAVEIEMNHITEYNNLCKSLKKGVVNQSIGYWTKRLTGGNSDKQVAVKQKTIIRSYTRLIFK